MSKLDIFQGTSEKPVVYRQKLSNPRTGTSLYHVTLHFSNSDVLASGTDADENLAINKACSEAVERIFYNKNNRTSVMRFDELNSTSCMAAGFDLRKTVQRSNNECAERYLKLLISDGKIAPLPLVIQDVESLGLSDYFEKTEAYYLKVSYQDYSGYFKNRFFVLCLCWLDNIFVTGSSVNGTIKAATDHSLVEAKRNLTIVNSLKMPPYNNFKNKYYIKIQELSTNGKEASKFLRKDKPGLEEVILPQIYWQQYVHFMGAYVCRSFVQGYLSALENQRELF